MLLALSLTSAHFIRSVPRIFFLRARSLWCTVTDVLSVFCWLCASALCHTWAIQPIQLIKCTWFYFCQSLACHKMKSVFYFLRRSARARSFTAFSRSKRFRKGERKGDKDWRAWIPSSKCEHIYSIFVSRKCYWWSEWMQLHSADTMILRSIQRHSYGSSVTYRRSTKIRTIPSQYSPKSPLIKEKNASKLYIGAIFYIWCVTAYHYSN